MRNCPNEREIDRYLLGRLSEDDAREFEVHYFNCPPCFEKVRDRQAVIESVARKRAELLAPPTARPAFAFRARAWTTAAAAAGVLLMITAALVLRPWERGAAARSEDVVRGAALAAISPAGDVSAVPEALAWSPGPTDLEYRVELTGPGLSWSAAASGPTIALPEGVRAKLGRGIVYTWQVKGYAPEGTLLERSNKTAFRIR
jgi:anti-sigma factor RsiW